MKTNITQYTGRVRVSARLKNLRRYGIGLTLTAVAAGAFIFTRHALADPVGLAITALAQGFSTEHEIHIQAKGPNDVLQAELVFQPGGETGWHTHPGPVIVVVKTGALTETHRNGCVTVHPAGSVFFESAGEVHRAVNQTGGVTDVFATFISPAGAPPLQPTGDPGGTCRDRN
jgi:quercetin dioxygenase-like cupin family protein